MFGELISKILSYLLPIEAKLFLFDAASYPVEVQVQVFGAFPAHVSGEDAVGGFVVSINWGGRLRMDHSNQGRVDGNRFMAVEGDCISLSLGGGCHDGADGLALGEYWAVWGGSRTDGGGVLR